MPEARGGVLDLSAWDADRDGIVRLDGEWEFYWGRLLGPRDFNQNNGRPVADHISVPGVWDDYRINGRAVGARGCATYRLIMKGPPSRPALALYVPFAYSSYAVYLDGKPVARSGRIGASEHESTPQWSPSVIPFERTRGSTELIVQVSNFVFRRGGLRQKLELGSETDIVRRRNVGVGVIAFLCGAVVIMGFYHLILFALRKKDRSPLYFGLVCLVVGAYTLVGFEERILLLIFPKASWQLIYRMSLGMYIMGMSLFFFFLRVLFPREVSGVLAKAATAVNAAYLLLDLFMPNGLVSRVDPFYHPVALLIGGYLLWGLARAAVNRREGARAALAGGFILYAALVVDLLYDYGMGQLHIAVPIGVFFFIMSHSFMLSKRFAGAFSIVERQEAALAEANVALEAKVRERTAGLERMVQEKDVLLREIHHRVKNNLQVVVSLLNLQSDELANEAALHAIAESKRRIRSMSLIHETLYNSKDLSRIDFERYAGQIVSDIFAAFGADRGGIDFRVISSVPWLDLDAAAPCGLIVNELVTNSLKHSFNGRDAGMVRVGLGLNDAGEHELSIEDDGCGLPSDFTARTSSSLGMRLVFQLVERQLKGSIAVDGEKGARFKVTFKR